LVSKFLLLIQIINRLKRHAGEVTIPIFPPYVNIYYHGKISKEQYELMKMYLDKYGSESLFLTPPSEIF
ncbi:MAG: hypothetical protein KAU38_12780, partial [Desulfobacterales bacterium]|nr:hypothetical protein [Desulfobacterales bacterium]